MCFTLGHFEKLHVKVMNLDLTNVFFSFSQHFPKLNKPQLDG